MLRITAAIAISATIPIAFINAAAQQMLALKNIQPGPFSHAMNGRWQSIGPVPNRSANGWRGIISSS